MKVLIACEFSGVVRDAFSALGHDAWSCDSLECEGNRTRHILRDVRNYLAPLKSGCWRCSRCPANSFGEICIRCGELTVSCKWDMLIAFPPCTHLCVSGARWFAGKQKEQAVAVAFVRDLMDAPIERIAIENPVGVLSTRIRKPDQIIQPYEFGHGEVKKTCLWLKNLPLLAPTQIVAGRVPRVHHASPGPNRWKERSRTLAGIALAMASQWGTLPNAKCVAAGESHQLQLATSNAGGAKELGAPNP